MSIAGGTVTEGGLLEYVVTLSCASEAVVTAIYQTEPGFSNATAQTDYSAVHSTVTFQPGETEKTVQVQTVDDQESEHEEHLTVSLRDPRGAEFAPRREYTPGNGRKCPGSSGACASNACCSCGWISDNDPPVVSVSDARGPESAGSLGFRLSLNKASQSAVSVRLSTGDGTAKSGEDYTSTATTVQFDAGTTERTAAVPIVNDDKLEPDETFSVTLSNPMGATIRDGEGTGTILDDDNQPTISVSDTSALESYGKLEFAVRLSNVFRSPVSVTLSTEDGTATSGEDYTSTSETVRFSPGENERIVEVPVLDDDEAEPNETVIARLSNPMGAAIGDGEATGTIVNGDTPLLDLQGSSAVEGGTVEFALTLSVATRDRVSVHCSTVYDPWLYASGYRLATEARDYRRSGGTLSFAPGETETTLRVQTNDDSIDEPDEAVVVYCSSARGARFVRRGGSTLCPWGSCGGGDCAQCSVITDNDAEVELTLSDASALESAGTLRFPARLSAATERTIRVRSSIRSGTAVENEDYSPRRSSSRLVAPGPRGGRTTGFSVSGVSIIDDDIPEPDETFTIRLWGAEGVKLVDAEATGTILNDDEEQPPTISVADARGAEGSSAGFTVSVTGTLAESATVDYATSDGSALAGEDYGAASGTLTFDDGDPQTVAVPLLDDAVDEPPETFTLTLSNAAGATIERAVATGTIEDNDDPPLFSVADATGTEGGTLGFRVTLSAASAGTASVGYALEDGTAVAGTDYTAVSGTLTFAPGETSQTVVVDLLDDAVDEPPETFTLTLSNAAGATIERAVATGTIEDNDDPPLFSVADATGTEGGTLGFRVTLSAASAGTASVGYALEDGTAVAGTDYTAVAGTLTFAPGETLRTVTVELLDDAVDEPTETFTIRLSSPGNAGIATGSAQGTVLDDDGAPQLAVRGGSAREGETLDFAVTVAGSRSEVVRVSYATRDGTARAGADYTAVSGALTFAPRESRKSVRVALLDDASYEGDESFRLVLSSPENAELAVSAASGTILDTDAAPRISVRGGSGREGETLEFVLEIAGSGSATVRVTYATRDGTARAGTDYTAVSGTLEFAPGETRGSVRVELLEDAVAEGDEHFRLTLSSPQNAQLSSSGATGTIVDAGGATRVLLSASPSSVAEGGGPTPVTVTATLEGSARTVATTVSVRVSGSGDPEAVDFEAVPDFDIEIAAGERSGAGAFMLVPEDDGEDESDETLTVSGVSDLPVRSATVVLTDAEALRSFRVLLFESAGNPHRQGFLRTVNHSPEAGEVYFEATDDGGVARAPITLSVDAGEAAHFNSDDLERGNAAKGLSAGVGTPTRGEWRLLVSSDLDIEVLAYSRTKGELGVRGVGNGFVTSVHDVVPVADGVHRVAMFNPGRNRNQASVLRLVNTGEDDVEATIAGTDDAGSASGEVRVRVAAERALTLSAPELESGAGDGIVDGALGTGTGKWRLRVATSKPLAVKSLLVSGKKLANLSTTVAGPPAGDVHRIPLFPPASGPGYEGVLRVLNDSAVDGLVRIEARDDRGIAYGPVTLEVGAYAAAQFNSTDLEQGNAAKGLVGGTGAPANGFWRLEATAPFEMRVMALARSGVDGFLTAIHDVVPVVDGAHRVLFFNPAENRKQVSRLRLVNDGAADATVRVTGVDDDGNSPGSEVRLRVAAGTVLEVGAEALESGQGDGIVAGALGDGAGKWRLRVASNEPVRVMSLLRSPTGHLSNLSSRLSGVE